MTHQPKPTTKTNAPNQSPAPILHLATLLAKILCRTTQERAHARLLLRRLIELEMDVLNKERGFSADQSQLMAYFLRQFSTHPTPIELLLLVAQAAAKQRIKRRGKKSPHLLPNPHKKVNAPRASIYTKALSPKPSTLKSPNPKPPQENFTQGNPQPTSHPYQPPAANFNLTLPKTDTDDSN